MNQILDYNPNKNYGSGGSSGSDVIVRVFAVLLALFALVIIGIGVYTLYNNKKDIPTVNEPIASKPNILVDVDEDNSIVIASITHDKALDKIVYNWDDEKENTVDCNGETDKEIEIKMLAGEHRLTINVTDVDGNSSTYTSQEAFVSQSGEDKEKPTIETEVSGNKLIVTAKDETEIEYATYRWNDEEETKVEAEEGSKELSFDIEIKKGQNDLMIVAVDKNKNSTSKEASYTGVTKPEITITVNAEKTLVGVQIIHETGIKEVLVEINGVTQNVEGLDGQNLTNVAFNINIAGSRNTIKVVAVSVDNTKTEVSEEIINENIEVSNIDITVAQLEEDKKLALVALKSEEGMKEIKLNLNGAEIPIDLEGRDPATVKDVSFNVPLADGNNTVVVTVVRPDGIEKTITQEIIVEEQ